ncbi:hypothetical protein [Candidatus Neptunochlamydia vexilliferae]|uniref:Uncharacterized protein n=1 Tax=Candidatus Neptunichlamydia vexilliferae TaxID=1651774 RepID=A0ABS0AZB3_9BACT|nr:hypothetical protein [Candidatus Neptunochlamydia vexilliferae]MBF5059465.1 hypothetical protein [Candidatus Neptunochlamydia vexilliferae]
MPIFNANKYIEPTAVLAVSLVPCIPAVLKMLDGTTRIPVVLTGALSAAVLGTMQDKKTAEKVAATALAYFLVWGVARTAKSEKFFFHWKGAALGAALAVVATLLNLRKVRLDFKFKALKGTGVSGIA